MPVELAAWLEALAATPVAALLRTSTVAYATLNAAHIFSIGLVVGSIATLDLRVLGLFRGVPLGALASPLSRIAAAGLLLAVTTGFFLFSVRPLTYAQNPAFLTKISLVALGVRLARYPQLYSRIGFAHQYKPLDVDDLPLVLTNYWNQLGVPLDPNDTSDFDTVSAVVRITGVNFRLIERLMTQVARVMEINQLDALDPDVIHAARQMLVVGAN